MFNTQSVSCELGGKKLTIETGKLAKQADGSVYVSYGDTRVLVTVCSASQPREGADFLPLTVEFAEKFYAAGKIPGSFLKREGRPGLEATLACRLIDRPIRPLFPEGWFCDTQLVATIVSLDKEADAEVAASIGASAALSISDIPFNGPTAAVRMGRVDGKLVVNPTWDQLHERISEMDIFIAGTRNAIMMVEGSAQEVPEDEVLQAILQGHEEIKNVINAIDELVKKAGKPKREFTPPEIPGEIKTKVEQLTKDGLMKALRTKEKQQRYMLMDEVKKAMMETVVPTSLKESDPAAAAKTEKYAKQSYEDLKYNLMREMILTDKIRIDGRDTKTIRPIATEASILPRAHGSSLFTRGETQVLAAVTLGTGDDEQIIDSIYHNGYRKVMLHYNFPPYSVGETGRFGGQSRREIGHGNLAERAIIEILPKHEDFRYTIRMVCETLESNGSSSMGSVCSASMALMDAGVPVKAPVAGIAMGLIKEGDRVAILSDILGDEDHLGDMDFKVAGTDKGVTAIQMDIKIEGVNEQIMRTALAQAHEGRLHILGKMAETITKPREEMSQFAPRMTTIKVPTDKIRDVIGPGGKVIKEIVANTGCKVNIEDDGSVHIASSDPEATQAAIDWIKGLTQEVELGKVYKGLVKKVVDFGAFVGLIPSQDGLLHVSEIAHERVNNVLDYMKEGDEVEVKVIDIDSNGKVRLSRKVLLPVPEGYVPPSGGNGGDRGPRGPRGGDRDRGGRGGRGGGRGGDRGPRQSGDRDRQPRGDE